MADSLEGGVAALEAEFVAIERRRIETEAELKTTKARTRTSRCSKAWPAAWSRLVGVALPSTVDCAVGDIKGA